jgi:hypothetical protein
MGADAANAHDREEPKFFASFLQKRSAFQLSFP